MSASNLKPTVSTATIFYCEASQCTPWQHKSRIICTDLKVCSKSETNVFCRNYFLMVKRLNVVHGKQSPGWSVLIWKGLLRVWNQRFLQQLCSHCETLSCCPWQPEPSSIGADLNRSASDMKPIVSATIVFLLWNVSMLSMTPKSWDNRCWCEGVCFKSETDNFCNNHFLIVKRHSVVRDRQRLGSSVTIWRGLLRISNQRILRQPFSYCETSQCCPWQPKPRNFCAALKSSASNLKPTISAATAFLW